MKMRAIRQAVIIATPSTLGVLSAGQAAAQSSVTIYGIVDACLARADLGTTNVTRLSPGCQAGKPMRRFWRVLLCLN